MVYRRMREVIGHLLATARRDDVGGVDRRIGEAFDMRLLARNIVGVAVQRGAAMRAEEVSSQYVRELVILRAEGLPNRIRVDGGDMIGFAERVASDLPVTVEMCLRSEAHTSELPSLMRNSYTVFCLKKKIR